MFSPRELGGEARPAGVVRIGPHGPDEPGTPDGHLREGSLGRTPTAPARAVPPPLMTHSDQENGVARPARFARVERARPNVVYFRILPKEVVRCRDVLTKSTQMGDHRKGVMSNGRHRQLVVSMVCGGNIGSIGSSPPGSFVGSSSTTGKTPGVFPHCQEVLEMAREQNALLMVGAHERAHARNGVDLQRAPRDSVGGVSPVT